MCSSINNVRDQIIDLLITKRIVVHDQDMNYAFAAWLLTVTAAIGVTAGVRVDLRMLVWR